jgi:hypothetical protein
MMSCWRISLGSFVSESNIFWFVSRYDPVEVVYSPVRPQAAPVVIGIQPLRGCGGFGFRCVHRLHLWLLGFNRFAAVVVLASGASVGCTYGYWDFPATRKSCVPTLRRDDGMRGCCAVSTDIGIPLGSV